VRAARFADVRAAALRVLAEHGITRFEAIDLDVIAAAMRVTITYDDLDGAARVAAKVQLGLLEGKVIELPLAATGSGPAIVAKPRNTVTQLVTAGQPATTRGDSWRSGRDLNPRPPA
jgi:hypothetical protein